MNRTTFLALGVALLTLVPSGLATWASYASLEPDTRFDINDGYMFTDAPGTATHKVYFNAYANHYPAGTVSPNSGAVGNRVTPLDTTYTLLLGVWADCNHDGFIGLADGAFAEYRVEASAATGFPVDLSICPVVADTPDHSSDIHNDGNWITELIPIVRTNATQQGAANNSRVIMDPTVKIWGDFGAPVTPATEAPPPSGDCTSATIIPPFDTGGTRSTGSILHQVDCDTGNAVWHAQDNVASRDPTGTLSTIPSGKTLYNHTGAPLYVDLLGDDASQKSYVSGEQDCSNNAVLVDGSPLDPVLVDSLGRESTDVRSPGTIRANPGGSVAGTVNETTEEIGGSCNPTDDNGHDVYGNGITERAPGQGGSTAGGQVAATFDAEYGGPMTREPCAASTAWQNVGRAYGPLFGTPPADPIPGDPTAVPALTCGMSDSAGLQPLWVATYFAGFFGFGGNEQWWAAQQYLGTTPNVNAPVIHRDDITNPSVEFNTFGADFTTFYASTSATGIDLPHPTTGTYGAEFCTAGIGTGAGIQNGWDCDPSHWNLDPLTGVPLDDKDLRGNVGDAYNLRDVDCYDTNLVSKDAHVFGKSLNPTNQDLGPRSVPVINNDASGCF